MSTVDDVRVAIKIINTATLKEDYVLRNLEREARILSSVTHPCILYIYETIQYHSLYCIVTELLPGKELCDFVSEHAKGRLNERTTRRFVRQLASALEHMHSKGIVHRDLKMQNIVVDTELFLVKIIDFGISNFWSLEEPLSTHCGSPEYAAPELFVSGRKYGPEVDLWSLGVVIFRMSAGSLPFQLDEKERSLPCDQQRRLLISRIRKGILQKHRNSIAHFSKDFGDLMSGLLKTNPKERFRVEHVLCHSWTTKSRNLLLDIPKTERPETGANGTAILKLCKILSLIPKDAKKKIMVEPLGPIGGMYRILYHEELKKHWELFGTISTPKAFPGSQICPNFFSRLRKQRRGASGPSKANADRKFSPVEDSVGESSEWKNKEVPIGSYAGTKTSLEREPWSGNFSSTVMNEQMSLLVASLRNGISPYNYKRFSVSNIAEANEPRQSSSFADVIEFTVDTNTSTTCTSARTEPAPKSGFRKREEHIPLHG